ERFRGGRLAPENLHRRKLSAEPAHALKRELPPVSRYRPLCLARLARPPRIQVESEERSDRRPASGKRFGADVERAIGAEEAIRGQPSVRRKLEFDALVGPRADEGRLNREKPLPREEGDQRDPPQQDQGR